MSKVIEISCPNCQSILIVRYGRRKIKHDIIQVYKCKSCNKFFSDKKLKHKSYNANIILGTISTYNLGYTLKQTKKEIAKRHHINVPESTMHSWIKQYSNICTFNRLRNQAIKLYKPEEMVFSQNLKHKQIYKYQFHKAKLELTSSELQLQKWALLKNYLEKIPTDKFPHHIFQPKRQGLGELSRSSQIKFETNNIVKSEKNNLTNMLTSLGLLLTKSNKQRHEAVQGFMLINDSTTIATEIPVYLTYNDIKYFKNKGFILNIKDYRTPITGHIDILQIRNKFIHILDYKPEASKADAVNQLTVYALALASRTKLAVKNFKAAWFDENNYYEFFPLHAVYKKQNI